MGKKKNTAAAIDRGSYHVHAVLFHASNNSLVPHGEFYTERKPLGWMAMIFGPGWTGAYGMIMCAMADIDISWRDPKEYELFGTPEAAMSAWENGEPVDIKPKVRGRYALRDNMTNGIQEALCYRKSHAEEEQEEEWSF